MDILKKLFPFSFKSTETNSFVIALIIYVVIAVVGGIIIGVVGSILGSILSILGTLVGLVGGIVDLYALIGIVLSILVFTKVLKD